MSAKMRGHRGAWIRISGLAAFMFVLPGCWQQPPPGNAAGENPIVRERQQRDLAFKESLQSPIPQNERARFRGLNYYPIDPALRFKVTLNRHAIPERIRMGTNTGEIREGLRYGYFEFPFAGAIRKLEVYRLDDSAESGQSYLFIPFRDATTGKETYGAGRYIDLPENTSGIYDLDFNRAYNPYCAYGDGFSCPVPPEENRLSIPIRAGEKTYLPAAGF